MIIEPENQIEQPRYTLNRGVWIPMNVLIEKVLHIFGDEYVNKDVYTIAQGEFSSLQDVYIQLTGDSTFTGRLKTGYSILDSNIILYDSDCCGDASLFGYVLSQCLDRIVQYEYTHCKMPLLNIVQSTVIGDFRDQCVTQIHDHRVEEMTYCASIRAAQHSITIDMIRYGDAKSIVLLCQEIATQCERTLNPYILSLLRGNHGGTVARYKTVYNMYHLEENVEALCGLLNNPKIKRVFYISSYDSVISKDLEDHLYHRNLHTSKYSIELILLDESYFMYDKNQLQIFSEYYSHPDARHFIIIDTGKPMIEIGFVDTVLPRVSIDYPPAMHSFYTVSHDMRVTVQHNYGGIVRDQDRIVSDVPMR